MNDQGEYNQHGGDQVQVTRGEGKVTKLETESKGDGNTVHHRPQQGGNECARNRFVAKDGLTDDNRCQPSNDGSHAHVDVGSTLVLGDKGTGNGDQCIGQPNTEDDDFVGIHSLTGNHLHVVAGCKKSETKLCMQEPDKQSYCHNADNEEEKRSGHVR